MEFRKVRYLDEYETESYHIRENCRDFDTIGIYEKGKNGELEFINEIDPFTFKDIVLEYTQNYL